MLFKILNGNFNQPKKSTMKKIYSFTLLLVLTINFAMKSQYSTILNPVQDAYFLSFGGGQGANPMLKFNISSLPAGAVISNAILQVYVWDTTNATNINYHLGNMVFRNLNNRQGWVEGDTAQKFSPSNQLYTDSVTMLAGFGDTIGWATSSDIKSIVIRDHSALNSFCTISMKDPDDVTCCGAIGPNFSTYLGDSPDSILTGNKLVGTDQIIFYPREHANQIPKLTINYSCPVNVGIVASGNSITANEATGTYQWLDCNNGNSPIGGETNQTYNAFASGAYAVIVTKNGCSDTSVCTNIVYTGISRSKNSIVLVYPNPVKDFVTVELNGKETKVVIYDLVGRIIYQETSNNLKKLSVDMSNEKGGIYFLKAGNEVVKIIKE